MTKLERIQRDTLKRMSLKRRNRNNWPGAVMTTKTPQDIIDWNAIVLETKGYKPKRK